MSSVWLIRICIFAVQVISSVAFIYHERYKISYVSELVWVAVFFYFNSCSVMYVDLAMYAIEYVLAKIVILLLIYFMKLFSFYLLASATRLNSRKKISPGLFSKVCFIFLPRRATMKMANRFWNNVNYGIRISKGNPVMINKIHAATKVKFDSKGFPKFDKVVTIYLPREYWNKDRETHFYKANKILYEKVTKSKVLKQKFTRQQISNLKNHITPSDYTWHHHQERGRLDLVLTKVHSKVPHRGGFAIWGKRK